MQVLNSPTHATSCALPDEIPGQVNFSPDRPTFSFFSVSRPASPATPHQSSPQSSGRPTWTSDNAATSGLQFSPEASQPKPSSNSQSSYSATQQPAVPACLTPSGSQGAKGSSNGAPARWPLDTRAAEMKAKPVQAQGRSGKGPINEVVCGAMMLAYERAGKWHQVSHCLIASLHTVVTDLGKLRVIKSM